jgi:hypothetical protein
VGSVAILPVVSGGSGGTGGGTGAGNGSGTMTNFAVTAVNGNYSITQAGSVTTVTCPAGPYTYNGAAQTPCSVTVTGAGGLSQTPTASYSNNVNAGTATASYTFAGDTNHTGSNDSKTFTIDKAVVTATAGGGTSVFDGTTKAPSACVVSGAYIGNLQCSNSPASVGPDVGSVAILPVVSGGSGGTGGGTGAGNGSGTMTNFAVTAVNGNYSITQAASVTTVSCPAGPYTYNGAAQTPCSVTVTGAGGLNLTPTASYTNNVNAGTATASYTFAGDTNHSGSNDSKNFTIDKAVVTVTAGSGSATYDGTPHAASACLFTGFSGNLTCENSPASATNAGNYPITPLVSGGGSGTGGQTGGGSGSANFVITPVNGTLTIAKANAVITVTPYSVTYDGVGHTATGSAAGVESTPANLTSLLHLEGTAHTNAGDYATDAWTFDGNSNYNATNGTTHDAIAKAVVTVTAGSGSTTYDGSAHAPSACQFTGFSGNLTCANDPASVTNAGSYTVTPVVSGSGGQTGGGTGGGSGSANFVITAVNGSYTVAKANATITVNPYSVTYDGVAHTATGTASGVESPTPVDLTSLLHLGGTTHTNAGDYASDAWTFDGNSNYNATSGTTHDAIAKAVVTVTAGSGSGTYDGTGHAPSDCQFSGFHSNLVCANSPASVTDAGTHTITPVVSGAGSGTGGQTGGGGGSANFTVTPVTGTFTLTKANAVITVAPYSVTYDATVHTATATAKGVLNEDLAGLDLSGTTHTNASDYSTDTWTFTDVTGNYNNASGMVHDAIAKATPTVTATGGTFTYTGAPHAGSGSATGGGGASLTATLTYSGTGTTTYGPTATAPTGAGTYQVVAHSDGDGNNNPCDSAAAPLVIDKASSTTTVTVSNATYDGNPHGASAGVSGAGALSQSLTVTYAGHNGTTYGPSTTAPTSAGDYTASASFEGDTNHSGSSDTKDFAIAKAASTTTVLAANAVYDGNSHGGTATAAGAGGLNQGLTVSYVGRNTTVYPISTTPPTNAGDYTASAMFNEGANHLGSNGSKDFAITKAPVTATAGGGSATYDGSAKTPSACQVTGPYIGSLSCANNPSSVGPGAGTTSITPVVNGVAQTNFNITLVNGSYTIAKKGATLHADDKNKNFGEVNPPLTAAVSGLVNGDVLNYSLTTTATTGSAVGSYPITVGLGSNPNYDVAPTNGTLTIGSWRLKGFYQPVGETQTYNTAAPLSNFIWNTVKGGSTVPLKLNVYKSSTIGTNETANTVDIKSFALYTVSCGSSPWEDPVDAAFLTTGGTWLRYSGTPGVDGQFIQNWSTPKVNTQTCYQVVMTTQDQSVLVAYFKLTK